MPRKRKKRARKTILEDFAKEVMSEHEDMKFLIRPKEEISMSDAILQLIEPFREDAPDYDSFNKSCYLRLHCVEYFSTAGRSKEGST